MTTQNEQLKSIKTLSIIVSVFNEEKVVKEFYERAKQTLSKIQGYDIQLMFVNDGSTDNSQEILQSIVANKTSPFRLKLIEFSRNYGHESAMIAGIDTCDDNVLICMDSDLQHPLEEIEKMLNAWENGYEIVLMSRKKRHDNGIIKNGFSTLFYKLIDFLSENRFEKNASDFFLISKNISEILQNDFRERNRFLRGFIQVIGFNRIALEYQSPERFAGKSNYSFKSLSKLGVTAIFAFSNKPLKISLVFSMVFFIFSVAIIIYSLIVYFWGNTQPPAGYTSMIILMSLGFTVLSLMISILSIYFGRSLDEIRNRPMYLIKSSKTNQTHKTKNNEI